MSELTKVFEGEDLRMLNKDEPLFALVDVCKILDIGNSTDVRNRLEDGVVTIEVMQDGLGRLQKTTLINEDGLYDVILDSRKVEARKFRKWITSEVLPSIRKTGSYQAEVLTEKEQLVASMKLTIETSEEVSEIKEDVKMLKDTMRISSREEGIIHGKANSTVVRSLGGKNSSAYKTMNRKAFSRFWSEFKRYFVVSKYGDIPKKEFENAVDWISSWLPDTTTRIEIRNANKQMSMDD